MRLQRLLVILRLVHLEVREQAAALGDFAKQTIAAGLILLVVLQVLGQFDDFGRQNRDLHLGGARVFDVRAVLIDQLFLLRPLECHKTRIGNEK